MRDSMIEEELFKELIDGFFPHCRVEYQIIGNWRSAILYDQTVGGYIGYVAIMDETILMRCEPSPKPTLDDPNRGIVTISICDPNSFDIIKRTFNYDKLGKNERVA